MKKTTPTPPRTINDTLRRTIRILKKAGWRQGSMGDVNTPGCLSGVISEAITGERGYLNVIQRTKRTALALKVYRRLFPNLKVLGGVKFYGKALSDLNCHAVAWNDRHGRKPSEVYTLISRAIRRGL